MLSAFSLLVYFDMICCMVYSAVYAVVLCCFCAHDDYCYALAMRYLPTHNTVQSLVSSISFSQFVGRRRRRGVSTCRKSVSSTHGERALGAAYG